MISFKQIIFLVALINFIFAAGWRQTRVLYTSGELASRVFTHINEDTGIVHNFMVTPTKILHKTFRTTFGPLKTLAEVQGVTFIDAVHSKHTAADQGEQQIIGLVYSAPRSGKNSKDCAKGATTGCLEVYIIESVDDGKTWSKPSMIKRADSNDIVHRASPSITYDREEDIIYIAYTHINAETKEESIGLIQKHVGESYPHETILKIPGNLQYGHPRLAVTNPMKHKGELHMCFIATFNANSRTVMYAKSTNNGQTWTTPLELTPNDHNSNHYHTISAVGIAGSQDVFISYSQNAGTEINFIYSKNAGTTWSAPKQINKKPALVPTMKACGQTKALGVFFSMPSEDGKSYEMVYYNATDSSYKQISTPFKEYPQLTHIPMADCTGLTDESLAFVAISGAKNMFLFDDFNYNYPENN